MIFNVFCMDLFLFADGSSIVFLWFFNVFSWVVPLGSLWLSCGVPIVSPMFSNGSSMVFLWFLDGFPVVFCCFTVFSIFLFDLGN